MYVTMVCYRSDVSFDLDYYVKRHMPLVEEIMKPLGMVRSEVRTFAPNPDGSAPTFQVMATLYFESPEGLKALAASPRRRELTADLINFCSGRPESMVGEVVYSHA